MAGQYLTGDFASNAGRGADEAFAIFLQVKTVGTGMVVVTVCPGPGDYLDEVVVSDTVLGKEYEVIVGGIRLAFFLFLASWSNIYFASKDGFKMVTCLSQFGILFLAVVGKFLYTHHVAVIGDCNATHSISDSFVNQLGDAGLTVEKGILCMYV